MIGPLPQSQQSEWAIETHDLCKSFGHVSALQDITLRVPCGALVTVLGPNAAGKTTLLRVLATLTRPSTGRVLLQGLEVQGHDAALCNLIGWVGEQTLLYGHLSPQENLRFYGRMYGVDDLDTWIHALLNRLGVGERQEDPLHTLSRGMQQRVAIARAILHRPPLLLLDEPYSSLDRHGAAILSSLLGQLRDAGHTVLMTTHDLARASELGGEVLILLDGRLVQRLDPQRTADDLRAAYDRCTGERR